MTAPDPVKKLASLLKKLRAVSPAPPADPALAGCPDHADPLLWQLVFAYMAWDAGPARAADATAKLHRAVVDYNEMRVCLPHELVSVIGERYPKALERMTRLRGTLNHLYKREHAVSLAKPQGLGKREAREYLESLDGMPGAVAARLTLLAFGGHAFPCDERLAAALRDLNCLPPETDHAAAAGWLERHHRAGEAAEPFLYLEAWAPDRPAPRVRKPKAKAAEPARDKPARSKRVSKSSPRP
ncbi:MAG: hypothetical protein ACKVW3_04605 [Phycisphaerales bacterium]